MANLKPTRKVTAAGMGLPVAMILVWILQVNGVKVPPEISAAIGSIISFAPGLYDPGQIKSYARSSNGRQAQALIPLSVRGRILR